jgi:5-methylcytosine-specific restriction endonuclease McrA
MDKARALAAVAVPDTEAELLSLAQEMTAGQLSRALAAARRALSGEEALRLRRARFLDTWWDEEGMLAVRGRLCPEEGALFRRALEAMREEQYRMNRSAGFEGEAPAAGEEDVRPDPTADADDPRGAARADALVGLAESYLATGPLSGDHYQVVVHADADMLVDDGGGRCHLEGGPGLSAATLGRLVCESSLVWLCEDRDGNPVAISDKTQDIPASVRRAVRARDKGCVFPTGAGGCCGVPAEFSHVHHVVHREHGGSHTTGNCWTLCRFHHRLVHEGGFAMTLVGDGSLEVRRPDGTVIPTRPPATPPPVPPVPSGPGRLPLEPDVAWARSNGERMDMVCTVDYLLAVGLPGGP